MQPGDAPYSGNRTAIRDRSRNEPADVGKCDPFQRIHERKRIQSGLCSNGQAGVLRVDVEGFLSDDDEDDE